jgi:protein arginine kinase
VLEALSQKLDFARSERFGYLAASPENCGAGLRYSAMFHLVGLAQNKRLPTVIRALGAQGLVVRGLFGERSRAIGALTQVSTTGSSVAPFVGACDYLLKEERRARAGLTVVELGARQEELRRFVESAKALSLADSLRAMGWQRWLAGKGADAHEAARQVDALIPSLALSEGLGEPRAGRARADLMRSLLRAG